MRTCILIVSISGFLMANTRSYNPPNRVFQILRHDTNQVEMCVSNYGKFGQNETGNNAGFWWPIGTNHNYIYGAGLWFGAIDMGDSLVTIGYGPHGGESEFAPGLAGWLVTHPAAIIYMYPDNWPPPPDTLPMAPQDPMSFQDSWCVYNDCDSQYHMVGDTRPIGIEVYQTVYVWDYLFCDDIVFVTYDVRNVSGDTLQDCFFGVCADCDIGNEAGTSANDRCSGILERQYVIGNDTVIVDDVAYQWQEQEEPGVPPWWPGTIGFDLLQTPFDLVPGQDKDGDGILDQFERDSAYYVNNLPPSMWDVDNDGLPDWRDASENPQIGITALKQFTLQLEPNIDPERYATLAGYNFVTGLYEPFDTIPPNPDDQRFLMASGPFDLDPDSIVTLVFAVMVAEWYGIYQTPDSALALVDKWAQYFYDMYWFTYTGVEENFEFRISDCEMKILPNPASHNSTLAFSLPAKSHVSLKLYNIAGRLVHDLIDSQVNAGRHTVDINVADLPQGTYFLVLETEYSSETERITVVR